MIKRREMTMMMIMKAAISNRMSLFCFRGLMRGAREGRLIIITTTGDTEYSPRISELFMMMMIIPTIGRSPEILSDHNLKKRCSSSKPDGVQVNLGDARIFRNLGRETPNLFC